MIILYPKPSYQTLLTQSNYAISAIQIRLMSRSFYKLLRSTTGTERGNTIIHLQVGVCSSSLGQS